MGTKLKEKRLVNAINRTTENEFIRDRMIQSMANAIYGLVPGSEERLARYADDLRRELASPNPSAFRVERLTELVATQVERVADQRATCEVLANVHETITGEPMAPPATAEQREERATQAKGKAAAALAALAARK